MKKSLMLIILAAASAVIAAGACSKNNNPSGQAATYTPTATATATATPIDRSTIQISMDIVRRPQDASNDVISALILVNATPVPATVTVINQTQSITYTLADAGYGYHSIIGVNLAYAPGDLFYLSFQCGGNNITGTVTAPGGAWVSDYIPGTGVTITAASDGNFGYISAHKGSQVYSDNELSTQFTYPYTIPDSVFTGNGSGAYLIVYWCRNRYMAPFGASYDSYIYIYENWNKNVTVP